MGNLSTAFMAETTARAQTATLSYLDAGPRSLEVIREQVASGRLETTDDRALEQLFRSLLIAHGELQMFNYGMPNGDFLMVKRMPDGSFSTKRIRRRGEVAESTWDHANETWAREAPYRDRIEPVDEAYDPRPRPWYRLAGETGSVGWIEPYIFYSDRMPGIACTTPLHDPEGRLLAVVSADIGVAELSRHLGTYRIGRSGRAVILTEDGRIIADPRFLEDGFELAQDVGDASEPQLVLRRTDDDPEAVLTAAFQRRSPDGASETLTFEHDGEAFVARFESFPVGSQWRWLVGVLAPQNDFMGSLRRDHRITLTVTLVCFLLAILLAGFLIFRAAALELQLLQLRTVELEVANRAKNEFLANMSHELRTPMNGVIGMASLLQLSGLDTQQQECVTSIRHCGESLLAVIGDILDFSKIESSQMSVERAPFELRSAVAESLEEIAPAASEKGLRLGSEIAPGTPAILLGDGRLTRQILGRLLSNAVKFTAAGEVFVAVSAQAVASENGAGGELHEVHFEVRDTGIGVDVDQIERMFEPFSQVDSSTTRKYGGTGLGLAISKRLSDLLGGRIWIESTLGEGTTMHFVIRGEAPSDAIHRPEKGHP